MRSYAYLHFLEVEYARQRWFLAVRMLSPLFIFRLGPFLLAFFERRDSIRINWTEVLVEGQILLQRIWWMYGFISQSCIASRVFENDARPTRMFLRNDRRYTEERK